MPHQRHDPALSHDHARDAARLGAQGEPHADFAGALRDDVGHDAVDADDAEQQRDAAAMASSTIVNAICPRRGRGCLQRAHLCKRQVRIDVVDRVAHRGDQCQRRRRRPHDVAHRRDVGPINACRGMSGPPAIDIGMNSCAHGVGSASADVGVFETTPTIVSHVGAGSVESAAWTT